ncbi:urease accessory protein [Nitrosopumilus sp. b1]|uniref:urease accessory protein UreF n=1 Tax=Nitrosopumilus sp. b1 TaxID=2109907 RepID=UPI0015F5170F|nr:urease accessory UreF family protein [Nitrosopumilus sp. b1]KAF6243285.1 urease accessory protein [Nitrosopumilus sp. b1]
MNTEDLFEELGIMQLSDSFFPTGLFATSNGLEFLHMTKKISSQQELFEFIKIAINQQVGPADCVAMLNAYESAKNTDFSEIRRIDEIIFALKTIKEMRESSLRSGIQMLKCVREFVKDDTLEWFQDEVRKRSAHGSHPIAFALCCNALKIKKEKASLMLLYGFATSVVGAALRLGLIQHFEAQKILHQIKPVITNFISENFDKKTSEICQFSPQLDIFQMSHENMDSKMFLT